MNNTKRLGVVSGVSVCRPLMPIPFVCEEDGLLTLCFNAGSIQSQMRVAAPDELVLTYTRVIAAYLQFNPSPQRISMIGLGGGSIAKWCHLHLPDTSMTIVEINPDVIALRDRFYIPEDDQRFRILCEDGAFYVATTQKKTDVLIVDGFGVDGQPPELCSQTFYDDCYRVLTPDGLMLVNLCSDEDRVNIARIGRSFSDQIAIIKPEDGNAVVLARKSKASSSQDNRSGLLMNS